MGNVLDSFLNLGLIENIDGSDERYAKIEKSAQQLAEYFREKREQLIPAILSGLNPEVSLDEPTVIKAKELLQAEWKAFLTAYTDEPINLYRSIILEACSLVSEEENNAAIMWLTACDVLPLLKCGKEESALNKFLYSLGCVAEKKSLVSEPELVSRREKPIKLDTFPDIELPETTIDEDDLYVKIAGAAGSQYLDTDGQTKAGHNPNRYTTQNPPHWAGDFANRMSEILFSEFTKIEDRFVASSNILSNVESMRISVEKALNEQRLVLQRQQAEFLAYQKQEQTRLNVLWWAEALYSTSQKESYRVYSPELASVLMPYDLLEEIQTPSPASVAFTLSEAVSKLPKCDHGHLYNFLDLLTNVRSQRFKLDPCWLEQFVSKSKEQVSNIRGVIIRVLIDEHCDLESLISNSFIPQDWRCTLPEISRAIFRQEQAYRLAMGV